MIFCIDIEEWPTKQRIREEGLIEGIKCGEARRLVADIENTMRFFR